MSAQKRKSLKYPDVKISQTKNVSKMCIQKIINLWWQLWFAGALFFQITRKPLPFATNFLYHLYTQILIFVFKNWCYPKMLYKNFFVLMKCQLNLIKKWNSRNVVISKFFYRKHLKNVCSKNLTNCPNIKISVL